MTTQNMETMHMTHIRHRRGFTLIELLVVILILAVLAALIVPRVITRAGDAKRAAAVTDISTLSGLLETFRMDNDRYPTTEEGLQALRTAPADLPKWQGPYAKKAIPPDPWGGDYVYEFPGAGGDETYVLLCYGRDGQPGGEGDDMDITEGVDEN